MDMCFASTAKEFRNQMGGGPEAASLPQPDGRGVEKWEKVAEEFKKIVGDVEGALRKAEGAHQGKAAEEANASIAEVMPKAEKVSETSKGIRDSLQQQSQNQHEAFQGIPAQGDTLENGREVQLDPPQKGFVDEHKDNMFIGWMSDYEERQADFTATNEKATASRERYASQTDNVITALPKFEPDAKPAPPPPAADTAQASSMPAGGDSSSAQASGAPASTSSSWAPSGSGGGGGGGAVGGGGAGSVPGGGSGGPAPASTGAAWASPGGSGGGAGGKLPPGVVRGKDGTLYRQNPQTGSWERQNPHNGRWAPAPGGGPGGAGAGGARGAAGAGGGVGGGAGGAGAGAGGGAGSGQGQQPGAGGRSGTGMPGGSGAGAGGSGAGAAGGGAAGGRGGAAGPMGGAGGRGGQGGGDDEHERPSWLIEEEDVFSNDMQLVAPPVFGEAPGEGR